MKKKKTLSLCLYLVNLQYSPMSLHIRSGEDNLWSVINNLAALLGSDLQRKEDNMSTCSLCHLLFGLLLEFCLHLYFCFCFCHYIFISDAKFHIKITDIQL